MSTLGTIKTEIADDLARDDLASPITNAINAAIRKWEGTRFHFNEKLFKLNTVADQEYYAWTSLLNSDGSALDTGVTLLEIDSITLLQSSEPYTLWARTQLWMDTYAVPNSQHSGASTDYAIYADQLRLFPIPDQVYPITISGLARLKTLAADNDANGWVTEGRDLIRHQAKISLYRDKLRDMKGVELARDGVREALEQLTRKYEAKVSSGRLTPWGY